MDSLCKDHFLQRQYRKLDGGVLWSRNERNLDCTVTFQTHSILQRFMLHFDLLQLDCNDHLYVYDGAHATAPPKADLSCRNTKQQVGALFTRSNFVTLKYVTDNWGTDANGFKLVITAVKDPKSGGGGGSSTWIAIVVGAAALLALVVLLLLCCYCRGRAPTRRTHLHLQQMASSNGAGGGGKGAGPAASPATRLPGNWAHPAGPRGS
ncbi:jg14069 [Pararge aegeria aegeria]|uniref:Jg14069 protein n=1 Tax=Pararge aegeria aegeria TaxID=348720 RepID=A0A8S4SI93_9NEOP|nr:jg14069 [Pararge aegeria aegeria]